MHHHELIERLVDRMLYTIEQYTAGATEAVATLSEERYDAMRTACEQQLTTLFASCARLVQVPTTDAERYRHLCRYARGHDLTMDGTQHWYIGHEAIRARGRTLEETIDRDIQDHHSL